MRIVNGNFKGKNLKYLKNFNSRPTSSLVKESLVNILRNLYDFEQITILDLFAGTGGVSYEFASIGVEQITAIEQNVNNFNYIKSISEELSIDNLSIIRADVFDFLKNKNSLSFDLVFADPPYDLKNINEIPKLVFENNLLSSRGMLVVEHNKYTKFDENEKCYRTKKYGKSFLSFFEN